MAKKVEWRAPIHRDGSLMVYPERYRGLDENGNFVRTDPETVPRDTEWTLSLTFTGFDKGIRSAYRFIATDEDGRKWPMSVKQFRDMMMQVVICRSCISGRFGVVKQGQNFSLKYLGPVDTHGMVFETHRDHIVLDGIRLDVREDQRNDPLVGVIMMRLARMYNITRMVDDA